MREVKAAQVITCTPEEAFDFVADYRNAAEVLDGVRRWEPVTTFTTGVGARYDVEVQGFGATARMLLELVEWEPPRRIGWRSIKAPSMHQGTWTFSRIGRRTSVELDLRYQPPKGPLGQLAALAIEPQLRSRIERTLRNIAAELEGHA